MRSSTSSSRVDQSRLKISGAVAWAFALALGFVAFMEWRLSANGFVATAIDSEQLWAKERRHASRAGSNAVILVGASRIQLDVDLPTLRRSTGLEPVQLAIDGSGYLPILEGLARDPTITGTVIVDYKVAAEPAVPVRDTADIYQANYEAQATQPFLPDFAWSEGRLSDLLRANLRSYADGARPITSFLMRVLPSGETPQYLLTLPDRSRLADYRQVAMPAFYLARVARNLGAPPPADDADPVRLEAQLRAGVEALVPQSPTYEQARYRRILAATRAIEARGGRVLFIVMPTSGLVRRIDDRSFPREQFYDRFAEEVGSRAHYWSDYASLREFTCPDGSHLDRRDRERFTLALAEVLGLARNSGAPTPATSRPAATPPAPAAAARSP